MFVFEVWFLITLLNYMQITLQGILVEEMLWYQK